MTNVDKPLYLGDLINSFASQIKRNWIIIVILTLLGGLAGFSYSFSNKNLHQNSLVGYSDIVNEELLVEVIENLSIAVQKNDREVISSYLNIPLDISSEIVFVKADAELIKTMLVTEEESTKKIIDKKLILKIRKTGKDHFPEIQEGILYYFRNDPYLSGLHKINKSKNDQIISNITREMEEFDQALDSKSGDLTLFMQPFDNQVYIPLIEGLARYEHIESAASIFNIIKPFGLSSTPRDKALIFTILGAFAFMILAVLFIPLFKYVKNLPA